MTLASNVRFHAKWATALGRKQTFVLIYRRQPVTLGQCQGLKAR